MGQEKVLAEAKIFICYPASGLSALRGASNIDGEYSPAQGFMVVNCSHIFILVVHPLIDAQGKFLLNGLLPILIINAGALMSQQHGRHNTSRCEGTLRAMEVALCILVPSLLLTLRVWLPA